MRIGEVAERAGLSTKALRYYETVGLIDGPARTLSGSAAATLTAGSGAGPMPV